MIKHLKNNWLSLALAVVVIISLLLSWLVWTNPYQYKGVRRDNLMKSSQQYTTQSMGDVYLPTTIVRSDKHSKQYSLYSPEKSIVREMKESIRSWKLGRLSTVKKNNSDVYLSYLRLPNTIMLSYQNAIPTMVFNETFSQSVDSDQVSRIDHILIPMNGRNEVYLLTDKNYTVSRLRISKGNINKIIKMQKDARKIPVEFKLVNGKTEMTYTKSFSLPTFAFQVTDMNIDTLSTNLLSSNHRSNISSAKSGNQVIYSNGNNRKMTYNKSDDTVNYSYVTPNSEKHSIESLYSTFYNYLVKTGVQLNNVRFDGVDYSQHSLSYRTFVYGFPVFNEKGYSSIVMQYKNGSERIKMSRFSLQVPLPVDQDSVKLPSSSTVINQLRSSEHYKDIKRMRVGYLWKKSDDKNVVKLTPTYFVKYHGEWVNYEDLTK
ncbi:MAG: two-component system activity regulator YycH [Limosilactobacillus sp.]|uniref:YycH family regulatory protein n=1 Tax=Limosilactobacillus sp. TaxID=2773925 RepID=UPI00270C427A|nr:two-component system activity regulator YycH [Limosilactobacillus sp.]